MHFKKVKIILKILVEIDKLKGLYIYTIQYHNEKCNHELMASHRANMSEFVIAYVCINID